MASVQLKTKILNWWVEFYFHQSPTNQSDSCRIPLASANPYCEMLLTLYNVSHSYTLWWLEANNLIWEYKRTTYYLSAGISFLPVLSALQKKEQRAYKPSKIIETERNFISSNIISETWLADLIAFKILCPYNYFVTSIWSLCRK